MTALNKSHMSFSPILEIDYFNPTLTVLLGQRNRMTWSTQPYDLANSTVCFGLRNSIVRFILRRRKHRSTPWNILFYGGKTIRLPFGHSTALASAAARNGILVILQACQSFAL